MDIILKTEHLTKSFGRRKVVDDISLETYAGEVFGFLGPNGAGKTTTIKMIMGLLTRDSGNIFINGIDAAKDFEGAMACIGGIVENPEMYGYLTGLQNLRQYQRIRSGVTDERILEVVNLVKLDYRIKEKVKRYSLGMKQRLGVAQSIMHRPRLIILDEPTNGLDPAGIKELRDILKDMAHRENVGVFVSSHLLSEMQLMCDRVGIISNGRLLSVKSTEEMTRGESAGGAIYRYTVGNIAGALGVIGGTGGVSIVGHTDQFIDVNVTDDAIDALNAGLISSGVSLRGLARMERSLEDIFIEATSEGGGQIA